MLEWARTIDKGMNRILANAAAVCLACAAVSTFALGFGRVRMASVMGQPFEATVPLHVDAGDELQSHCISAQVFYAEAQQPAERVSTSVELDGSAPPQVRIRSSMPIDEPVVSVYLTVGCNSRMTRKWVSFADPPMNSVEPARSLAAASADPSVPVPAQVAAGVETAANESSRSDAGRNAAAARPAVPPAAGVSPAASAPRSAAAREPASRRPAARKPPVRSAAVAAAPAQTGRLQLDVLDTPSLLAPSLRLSAEAPASPSEEGSQARAAAAALWRAMNSSPEEMLRDRQRLAELEAGFERLRGDVQQSQQSLARMEARLRQAPPGGASNPWVAALGVLAAGLAVALVWVAWQRRRDQQLAGDWSAQAQDEDIQSTLSPPVAAAGPSQDAAGSPPDSLPEPVDAAPVAAVRERETPGSVPARPRGQDAFVVQEPPVAASAAAPLVFDAVEMHAAPAQAAEAPPVARPRRMGLPMPRPMSVEELIDLEQQAEFFVVLGQDEAAVDLLLAHLRSPAATSPLPYLKLLDLYQRRSDPVEYERVRKQFKTQFKVSAPAWDEDLAGGQTLDGYPSVMGRLQRLWTSPALALELLQGALLGKGEAAQPLALPAYRELLLLYAVARDLVEHDEGGVDVLLPLDDVPPGVPMEAANSGPLALGGDAALPSRRRETVAAAPGPDNELSFEAMNLFSNSGPDRRAR